MRKGNLKIERPYHSFGEIGPLILSPAYACLPAPVLTEGGGKCQIDKSLGFKDENDFQPNPVFYNLRIFYCHSHLDNTHSGDTP